MQDFIQHLLNGVSLGSIYALIALGYTMVYGILQLINFAHSDVYMVGAFAAFYVGRLVGIESTPGLLALGLLLISAMVACSLLALTIERLAYRPLRKAPKLNILITAIGVSLFLQYFGQAVFGAEPKKFPTVLENLVVFQVGGVEVKTMDLTVLGITLLMMFALNYLIFKTKMGKAMRAVSSNMNVASMMGVNTDRVIAFTFVVGSSLAGVAAVLVAMKYPSIDPLMGTLFGLKAFVAAVLGGIGSIPGAVVGGIIMGLSEEMVVAYLSSTYRDALAFGILILILVLKPSGLFGKGSIEKV